MLSAPRSSLSPFHIFTRYALVLGGKDSIMSEISSDGNELHPSRYISVPKAMQLIPKQFTGNPVELLEFIQNVEAAYEVVEPVNHGLLFKFVCAKIGGEAKTKLLARTHGNNWEEAKAILEENKSVRRALDYYAHSAFKSM